MATRKELRLESVRRRIAILEKALENPDSIMNVSADGISETWVPRKDLSEELERLYKIEETLSGSVGRLRTVDITRL